VQAARRNGDSAPLEHSEANLFLRQSFRRIRQFFNGLADNNDKWLLATADSVLGKTSRVDLNGG
jgi:hypothetical protein